MYKLVDLQDEAGEWQSITDAAQRRKVQNRINQRLSRQRKARGGADAEIVIKQWIVPQGRRKGLPSRKLVENEKTDFEERSTSPKSHTSDSSLNHEDHLRHLAKVDDELWCLSPEELKLRRRFRQPISVASITCDQLLTLIYMNVFRALTCNIHILGLDTELMCVEEYPSPFLPCSPSASSAITKLPHDLEPTSLQRTVEHHPWIDIFPCPTLRNNLVLSTANDEEEEQLCVDILGLTEGNEEEEPMLEGENRRGAIVWGDPWRLENWEISKALAMRWPWVFAGCVELQRVTNRRRVARGWKAIHFI